MNANKQLVNGDYMFPNPKYYLIIYSTVMSSRPM